MLRWRVDPQLKKEAEENYRTAYALSLEGKSVIEIIRELTFDKSASNITVRDIENLFNYLEDYFLGRPINGVGLEVGAGPAVFSSILARRSGVEKVYAVEICGNIVEHLAPKVVGELAGNNSDKVRCCVGDFNNIKLENESVDFIFDFFSLHHSDNPEITLKECARVLKKGGFLLALDKARPDKKTDVEIKQMLDSEYDEKYKSDFGLNTKIKLTRQMNGEREYRLKEWRHFFLISGFNKFIHYRLDQCAGPFVVKFIKKTLATLPPNLQIYLTKFLPHNNNLFDISWENRVFTSKLDNFRKEISLMVAYK